MPAIQTLKKKLRSIKSTQKMTKAMKTVSSIKFSRLNSLYSGYKEYGACILEMYSQFEEEFCALYPAGDSTAPTCAVVISSNKGLCGSFNHEMLTFAENELKNCGKYCVIAVGKKTAEFFVSKGITPLRSFAFDDIPTYEDAKTLLDELVALRRDKRISEVKFYYPEYVNMMVQKPAVYELFTRSGSEDFDDFKTLYIPDKQTVIEGSAPQIFNAAVYDILLQSAIGAQAATLLTMRSAYDTATEYAFTLSQQINRQRQSAVTADVIETSPDRR